MLKIEILNKLTENLTVISYDSEYEVLFEKEVSNLDLLVVDLEKEKFLKFKNKSL